VLYSWEKLDGLGSYQGVRVSFRIYQPQVKKH